MSQTEKILCIKRDNLPSSWVQKRSVVQLSFNEFTAECTRAGFDFITRRAAEKDPSLKQIIPYIVLQTRDLKKTALYSRNGSEKRLHDLHSIGIGGHINPEDRRTPLSDFKQILTCGMNRELDEELISRPAHDTPEFAGLISEDITDVGTVHLGAVFRILTHQPEAFMPGNELCDFHWVPTHKLGGQPLELWSELALELIRSGSAPEDL